MPDDTITIRCCDCEKVILKNVSPNQISHIGIGWIQCEKCLNSIDIDDDDYECGCS